MAESTYVEELTEGQIFSLDGGEDSNLWQVDLVAGIASLICNHTDPMVEYFYLEEQVGTEVFVLSKMEVAEHFEHPHYTGDRPTDDDGKV